MHPPSPVRGLRQKAAIGAVETMEETMRVLTINELMRLTRIELCALAAQIIAALPTFPEGSPQRTAAYINLRNIRVRLGAARLLTLKGVFSYATPPRSRLE